MTTDTAALVGRRLVALAEARRTGAIRPSQADALARALIVEHQEEDRLGPLPTLRRGAAPGTGTDAGTETGTA